MSDARRSSFGPRGRFDVRALIGEGQLGSVFRVFDRELEIEVALKSMRELSPEQFYRLKQEFRSALALSHRNLIHLYELFVDENECFFTMELIDGRDFVTAIVDSDSSSSSDRIERFDVLAAQLVKAVSVLHEAGHVHRDLKPSNVLVDVRDRVVLLDFDLLSRKLTRGAIAEPGGITGTYAYMAPEQRFGDEDMRSDLYSIGVIFYQALTGKLPLESLNPLRPANTDPRQQASEIPEETARLVALLLSSPNERPTISELSQHFLRRGLDYGTPHAPPLPFVGRSAEVNVLNHVIEGDGPRAASVSGVSGIGKSKMIQSVLEEQPRDSIILEGRCHPDEAVPFNAVDPLIDGLTRVLILAEPDLRNCLIDEGVAWLARLFPALQRVAGIEAWTGKANSVEVRRNATQALRILLGSLAQRQKTVLWIDDLQWADEDSTALLCELLRPPGAPPLCLVVSHRSDCAPELTDELRALANTESGFEFESIELGPLSLEDSRSLALVELGRQGIADPEVVERVADEAHGSPFLLTRFARRAPSLSTSDAMIKDTVLEEFEGLSPDKQEILRLLSLCGHPAERAALLEAAALGPSARPIVAQLESDRWLRSRPFGNGVRLESYHDRIRETLSENQSPELKSNRHLRLAESFSSSGEEPGVLAIHYHDGGDLFRASHEAELAGEKATESMAFARAAEQFKNARDWDSRSNSRTQRLLENEADTLTKAGHLSEGGEQFILAAHSASDGSSQQLLLRGTEFLLGGGSFDRAENELRILLQKLKIPFPRSPIRALGGAMGHLLSSAAVVGADMVSSATPTEEEIQRIDACYGIGRKLVDVDSARGAYFSAVALARACKCDDPFRLARSLCVGGGAVGALGGPVFKRIGQRMMLQAENIAAELDSEELRGIIDIAFAEILMLSGQWHESLARSDGGIGRLESIPGFFFECSTGRRNALRSIEEIGDIPRLLEQSQRFRDDGIARGNFVEEISGAQHLAFALLATGDVQLAREQLVTSAREITNRNFHMQHVELARRFSDCEIYAGELEPATRRMRDLDDALRSSMLMKIPIMRITIHSHNARLVISRRAAGMSDGLSAASKIATRLAKENRLDARLRACLIEAGVASFEGGGAFHAPLSMAIDLADECGMELVKACAVRRLAHWSGDERALTQSDRRLFEMGVVEPNRFSEFMIPGNSNPTG